MRRTARVLVVLFLLLPVLGTVVGAAADQDFVVIVHSEVAGEQISRGILSAIFTRQAPNWEDGLACQPVDQSMSSPLRAAFSEKVLQTPIAGVRRLWQSKISEGVQPPPVKDSDRAVMDFVKSTRGAIGYVSATATLPPDIKTMEVVD